MQQAGRWAEAIPLLEELARAQPRNVSVLRALATCLTAIERLPAARERIAQALAIEPRNAPLHSILAYTWKREAAWDNAISAIDRAIALDPANHGFVATKAEILHFAGRLQDAITTIEKVLNKAATVPAIASTFAIIALRAKRQADAIPPLKAVLARTDLTPSARIKYSFDLATLYDSMGDAASAWPLFEQGNRLKNERWDPAVHSQTVDTILRSWTRSSIAALPRSKADGSPFVFIVGMPRSGTSLIEQIISTTQNSYAAGERNDLLRVARLTSNSIAQGIPIATSPAPLATAGAVERFAEVYAKPVRALAPSARIITDKMPPNFLNLGLIQALLPGAKVIHCRRKAMDSCLSCYFQVFGGALSFAYNLEHCGRFYVDYERVMTHWHETLDLPILDVPYEGVVDDQEGWTRKVLAFLGLEFTPDALRFHESSRTTLTASNQQVREPIYRRSVDRWRAYSDHLEPLRKALGPFAES
ncbi:MAG: sulfotransferase [Phycisphaerae bacterium]|nr:sulfotransferase [Phycisphaerae bacterium]